MKLKKLLKQTGKMKDKIKKLFNRIASAVKKLFSKKNAETKELSAKDLMKKYSGKRIYDYSKYSTLKKLDAKTADLVLHSLKNGSYICKKTVSPITYMVKFSGPALTNSALSMFYLFQKDSEDETIYYSGESSIMHLSYGSIRHFLTEMKTTKDGLQSITTTILIVLNIAGNLYEFPLKLNTDIDVYNDGFSPVVTVL